MKKFMHIPMIAFFIRVKKADLEECDVCCTLRWQVENKDMSGQLFESSNSNKKGKAAKVLHYSLLVPRLRRIYA